ncbi:MAG: peptide ABC transporter substrate-binding protein [Vicinamibacterales bacterium]
MRLERLAAVTLIVVLGSSGACARRTADAGPSNDLLIVGYDREPDTLNRFATHILEDVETCIVEGLTTTDEKMNVVPLLAEDVPTLDNGGVELKPDGTMDVTWRLRPNLTWHDGRPVTSADVQFTVDAINDPKWNPESTDGFDRIASVETPDAQTAVVHYREVYAPYALQFVRGLLPKHVLAGRDIESANDYNRNPLGTGPYHLAEWKTGEHILLERVPDYWRGSSLPAIKRILFKFIPNTNTRINQLKSGEVHLVALVPWDKYREVSDLPALTVHRMMGNSYEHVTLNEQFFPPFADVRVRRALTHAIDRELITKTIVDGLAPVVHGPIQPLSWAFEPDVETYPFDPGRARQLLQEAGWTEGASGVREKAGRPLAFTLLAQSGFAVRENVAQTIQQQLHDVGVDMRIQLYDGTTISSVWFAGKFDAMLHWWHMPADPELTLFFAKDRTPPAGRNINYLMDDELTALLYASDRTVDMARRKALLSQAQKRLATLAPEIPLFNVTRLDAVPARLRHFKGNPTNTGVFWNVHEWTIE